LLLLIFYIFLGYPQAYNSLIQKEFMATVGGKGEKSAVKGENSAVKGETSAVLSTERGVRDERDAHSWLITCIFQITPLFWMP
jgi:hypothetical protein